MERRDLNPPGPAPRACGKAGTVLLTFALVLPSVTLSAEATPRYRMSVRLDPANGRLECQARIEAPGARTLRLSPVMEVLRLAVDGQPAPFQRDPDQPGRITLESVPSRLLEVEYAGQLREDAYPPLTSQVNMIGPSLVELAGYVEWYPRIEGGGAFDFALDVDVPEGFVTLTNGRSVGPETVRGGRAVSRWESASPVGDVLLVSAPGLRRVPATRDAVSVEVFGTRLPESYLETTARDVARAVGFLADTLGSPAATTTVQVVYSPRPGWGYVRMPLIVVSEDAAESQRAERFGPARDFRYLAHEVAHFWWHLADTTTPEDWLNEGLAEYAALLAAEEVVGPEFSKALRAEYAERSEDSATRLAIVETPQDSPEREVNRYARPVLLLDDLRQRYGAENTTLFLRQVYRRFAGEGRATTEGFLEQVGQSFGAQARDAVEQALHRTEWPRAEPLPEYAFSSVDAGFLGTWAGLLSQAGSTNSVVLHLSASGSVLSASLDSPDQGVEGIPVPQVRIDDDVLEFRLGNAGVRYRGRLAAEAARIEGVWKQAGVPTPLTLSRLEP